MRSRIHKITDLRTGVVHADIPLHGMRSIPCKTVAKVLQYRILRDWFFPVYWCIAGAPISRQLAHAIEHPMGPIT